MGYTNVLYIFKNIELESSSSRAINEGRRRAQLDYLS